jgi:hypothetical protein
VVREGQYFAPVTIPQRSPRLVPAIAILVGLLAVELRAQQQQGNAPPAPIAPAVITRDASTGQATVRAIKLTAPLVVDGKLDEDVYQREQPFGGLIQVVPRYGQPMTERSDVWVTYDDKFIYLTCRCYDSAPPDDWIANELRRDTGGLRNNDHIGVMFDTFYDRRSGFAFYTNPLGARADYSVVDEGGSNTDWNPVWTSKTGRFDGGWTVEMAIPLKSIRYRPGQGQVWGIQLRRSVRRKNEWAYLTPVPQILAGPQALNRISSAGTLVGLDLPPAGRNIELKPYGVSRVITDKVPPRNINDRAEGDIGGDLKYQVTPNLTFDATANTDFAQVEIDEQQVNLTRFSLFFPEKRDFFLEGRGVFDFARGGLGVGNSDVTDLPYLFYSRRIGLNRSRVIPIDAGGRLTGKMGPWAMGFMNIQTGDEDASGTRATNFTVLRLKRDVLRRSAIGVMATNRSLAATDTGSNQAYGIDGSFGLSQNVSVGVYWAATSNSASADSNNQSWQGRFDYNADRYGAKVEMLEVQRSFRPDVGFLRRTNFQRSYGELRFSPRPKNIKSVRKFTLTTNGEYVANDTGLIETRAFATLFSTEFQSSDQISLDVNRNFEVLRLPFALSGSPTPIPVGEYTFDDVGVTFTSGAQRRVSGALSLRAGEYWDGTIRTVSISGSGFSPSRIAVNKHLSIEPALSISRIERPTASFTTRLARARMDYGFTPLMFASALVQYNTVDRAVSTNARFRWEYAPGSELFLVYTDERSTDITTATPALRNRAFVVKVNRLLRY